MRARAGLGRRPSAAPLYWQALRQRPTQPPPPSARLVRATYGSLRPVGTE